ncbi:thiol reductant ABC exporter subunit CydD [Agromyces soli]|uniref:Thiol reductant ABC exporter subunit CydD n=1 Tax=Agromyces soli TaxID=659012 RepID=A0ABY4AS50_9MICO|nr:thiol reductant ABC exporter subunit CydD [Agromyces soli]UOE25634.1 thiol reductant ABC exporter subunit CydD [Agromyces soli]
MKPLDPRLIRRSGAARGFLAAGGAVALVQAVAVIGFAYALARLVTDLVAGVPLAELGWAMLLLVGCVLVRALAAWVWEWSGAAGAVRVKAELRRAVLESVDRGAGAPGGTGRLATLLGPGLDALDDYFGRYLPQLVLTVIAMPILLVAVWLADPLSGLILVIVLPLLPIFMALIGLATKQVQQRQWEGLQQLSTAFLEIVGGLSTLVVFNRAERQLGRIRRATDAYRGKTMRVLRVTFLSGFVLEFGASLSIALVAVSIGLRLVSGEMGLLAGLFVLVLAPEVFLPLRNVGAAFHASTEGLEASGEALDRIEAGERADASAVRAATTPASARSGADAGAVLRLERFAALRDGRAVAAPVDLELSPGEVVALVGPSGAGKSSLIAALLGFAEADGEAWVDGAPAGPAARPRVAWAGQQPLLRAGTVASNVRLGSEQAPEALLEEALAELAVGLEAGHPVGADGAGLSGGQQQRIAVARAWHRARAEGVRLLILDEPSSALDAGHEARLATAVRRLAENGTAVLVASHRPALVEAADRVVELREAVRVAN